MRDWSLDDLVKRATEMRGQPMSVAIPVGDQEGFGMSDGRWCISLGIPDTSWDVPLDEFLDRYVAPIIVRMKSA